MEHKKVIELEKQGKLLIGVDRAVARRFYTDVPISKIEEETGETPYLEKTVVWFIFLLGPVALILSTVLGFLTFGWWGIISLVFCLTVFQRQEPFPFL